MLNRSHSCLWAARKDRWDVPPLTQWINYLTENHAACGLKEELDGEEMKSWFVLKAFDLRRTFPVEDTWKDLDTLIGRGASSRPDLLTLASFWKRKLSGLVAPLWCAFISLFLQGTHPVCPPFPCPTWRLLHLVTMTPTPPPSRPPSTPPASYKRLWNQVEP